MLFIFMLTYQHNFSFSLALQMSIALSSVRSGFLSSRPLTWSSAIPHTVLSRISESVSWSNLQSFALRHIGINSFRLSLHSGEEYVPQICLSFNVSYLSASLSNSNVLNTSTDSSPATCRKVAFFTLSDFFAVPLATRNSLNLWIHTLQFSARFP